VAKSGPRRLRKNRLHDDRPCSGDHGSCRDGAGSIRRLPGRVDYGPLVLRRGFTADRTLFQWWRNVSEGNLDRRNIAVILRDQRGSDVARWSLYYALPTKYTGPTLRARGNDVAIESLELEVEGMELIE